MAIPQNKIISFNHHLNNQTNSLQQMQIWANRNKLKKLTLKSKFDNPPTNKYKVNKKNQVGLKISLSYKNSINQNQFISPIKKNNQNKTLSKLSLQKQKTTFHVDRNFFITNIKTHLNLYHHKQSSTNNFISINKINLKLKTKNNNNNKNYLLAKNQQEKINYLQTKSQRIYLSKKQIIRSNQQKHKKSISSIQLSQDLKQDQQKIKDFFCISPKNIYYSQQIQKNYEKNREDKFFYKKSMSNKFINFPFSAKHINLKQQSQKQLFKKINKDVKQIKESQRLINDKNDRPKSCIHRNSYRKSSISQLKNKQLKFNLIDDEYINSGWRIQNNDILDENQDLFKK